MNKKALWFGIKANIAATILLSAIWFLLSYILLLLRIDIAKNLYLLYLITWILIALSYYFSLKLMLKNSRENKVEKQAGLRYTLYTYVAVVLVSLLFPDPSHSFLLKIISTTVGIAIIYGVSELKIRSLKDQNVSGQK